MMCWTPSRVWALMSAALFVLASGSGAAFAGPNLVVSEFSLDPATPVRGQPVDVRIGVYNRGDAAAGAYRVEWWPGDTYASGAACTWNVDGTNARGGRILRCTYGGYPSAYAQIRTRVIVDAGNTVAETNEADNDRRFAIRVSGAGSAPPGRPNLYISEFSLTPETPVQGQPVRVRIGVYNRGNAAAGRYRVAWWPGENYPTPACSWTVESTNARGGRILTCDYAGYPSWYARLNTRAMADVGHTVDESDETDNDRRMEIRVRRP
ncbi:CARDB domain-containing protein [Roseovarius salis]|uniref:CARDB domain-containing protein n=1 Tax=Roseovarius salis TaxID=3376063 RepID=UPI0037CC7584